MDEDEVYIITIDDTTEKVSLFADSGGVTSFKGRIGAVVPTAGDYTTDQVTEANNLYYTEARVTDNASVQANTAKVGITAGQASAITANTSEVILNASKGTTSRFEARCLGQAVNGRIDNYASALANIGLKDSSTASILFDAKVCGVGEGKLFNLLPFDIYKDFTVARNSTATYVANDGLIKTALANVPRIDWTDSSNPALLSEPQATNLLTYSEDFNNTGWFDSNATNAISTVVSPEANSFFSKLTEDVINSNNHSVRSSHSYTSGQDYTISVFVKKSERTFFRVWAGNKATAPFEVVFDLDLGTVANEIDGVAKIQDYGNDVYRCSVSFTALATASTSTYFMIDINSNTTRSYYVGDGVSGLYIWGAQLEEGSTATSYIPTVATTVTRVADVVTLKTDGLGLTSITETINGVDQAPITTIPATYTVPVYNYGSEQVANGDFASDLSSWIDSSSDTFEQLSSWQGESGIMHIITSAANRGARQTGVYTIGIDYKFTAKLWIVSGGVYFGKNTDKIGGVDYTTIGEWIDIDVDFNPNSDSTLRTYTVGSGEFYLNNISVKEVLSAGVKINKIKMT